jgi:hypothetical protein
MYSLITKEDVKDAMNSGDIADARAIEIIVDYLHSYIKTEDSKQIKLQIPNFINDLTDEHINDIDDIKTSYEMELHVVNAIKNMTDRIHTQAHCRYVDLSNMIESIDFIQQDINKNKTS